ncbi:hypothetical protein ACS5PU_06695 [Pedobacter sp. GSP4]|uniref:hypothetical protein n=1 Tax=Pedobacter sp. GSP4 TaxID=3453716 RepID=UPI003EEB00E6
MRLVTCVGLLMVIPAIALLTQNNNIPDHKLPAVKTHQYVKPMSKERSDSVQLTKTTDVQLAAQNHPGVISGSSGKDK